MVLRKFFDLNDFSGVADVGSGGGFPGIPLAILFPKTKIFLIEVTTKKVDFLKSVTKELGLENVEVVQCDWRTFLRKTNYDINLFLARASLQVSDLARVFSPACLYKGSTLVYWASSDWLVDKKEKNFVFRSEDYLIGTKKRKLVFLKKT